MLTLNQHGWICPKCNTACAPWLPQCFCKTVTTTSVFGRNVTVDGKPQAKCYKCGATWDASYTHYCHVC